MKVLKSIYKQECLLQTHNLISDSRFGNKMPIIRWWDVPQRPKFAANAVGFIIIWNYWIILLSHWHLLYNFL